MWLVTCSMRAGKWRKIPVLELMGGSFMNFKCLCGKKNDNRQRRRVWRSDQFYILSIIQLWSQTPVPRDRIICKINKARCSSLPSWTRQRKSSWASLSLSSVAGPKLSLETIRKMMCLQRHGCPGKEAALNHLRPTSLAFLSLLRETLAYAHILHLLIMLFAYLQILTKRNSVLSFILDFRTMPSLNWVCYFFSGLCSACY